MQVEEKAEELISEMPGTTDNGAINKMPLFCALLDILGMELPAPPAIGYKSKEWWKLWSNNI